MKKDYPTLQDIIEKKIEFASVFDYTAEETLLLNYISSLIKPPEYLFNFEPEYKYEYTFTHNDVSELAEANGVHMDIDSMFQAIRGLKIKNSNVITKQRKITGISALSRYYFDKDLKEATVIIDARIIKALDQNNG